MAPAQLLFERAQIAAYAIWMMLGTLVFAAANYGTFQYGMRS